MFALATNGVFSIARKFDSPRSERERETDCAVMVKGLVLGPPWGDFGLVALAQAVPQGCDWGVKWEKV